MSITDLESMLNNLRSDICRCLIHTIAKDGYLIAGWHEVFGINGEACHIC